MSLRVAPGQRIDWHDTRIASRFSNFLFIDKYYRSHPVLRRIFSQARQHKFQSLLIESLSAATCPLLAAEDAALRVRRPDFKGSSTHRLSFWICPPDQPSAGSFLGYVIFKSDYFTSPKPQDHIYEAVLPPVRLPAHNNFIHCQRSYAVTTVAGIQSVSGVLYAQQNGLTHVCAHVALRSALACLLPEADISYAEMNKLADVDHKKRQVGGGKGLDPDQLVDILTGLGITHDKVVHEPSLGHILQTEFQRDLYGAIESGCPALMGFELEDPNTGSQGPGRHLVPVIGHTFNDDAWVPEAQRYYFGRNLGYFSSESWLSSYVLHDDNFGPYYCLPRHFLKKDNFRLVLGLQQHPTAFSASEAEAVGLDLLKALGTAKPPFAQGDWYDRFAVFSKENLLVLRSQLMQKADYLQHLREMRCWDGASLEGAEIDSLAQALPERFWMIEASAQELFAASRRKFGELLLSCTTPLPSPLPRPLPRPVMLSLLLAARLPGVVLMPKDGELVVTPRRLQGHTPIFTAWEDTPRPPENDNTTPAPSPEVFVSYAWSPESTAIVDQLQQAFANNGTRLLRDSEDIRYKDSIRDFMRRLGQGKCVVVILSEKYLKSESCMFELTEIAKAQDLRERIFPIVLPDANIYKATGRIRYVQHWENEIQVLDAALKTVRADNLANLQSDLTLYAEIRRLFDSITDTLKDMNALTPAQHEDTSFAELIRRVRAQLGGAGADS